MQKGWWGKHLNFKVQILWWEGDELLPFFAGVFFAVMFRAWSPFFLGSFCSVLLIKAKQRLPKGFLVNIFYYLNILKIPGVPCYMSRIIGE